MNFKFDLNLLSQYRTPLMGLAALMIVVCHALSYGVEMPGLIASLLERGGLGVDIFLFLSGIGCWYSLSKGTTPGSWYSKRFMRIFVPYLCRFRFGFGNYWMEHFHFRTNYWCFLLLVSGCIM